MELHQKESISDCYLFKNSAGTISETSIREFCFVSANALVVTTARCE